MYETAETFNNCAILDDYKMGEKIGEGGFGFVHIARNRETNKDYAVKFMDMTSTRKLQHFISSFRSSYFTGGNTPIQLCCVYMGKSTDLNRFYIYSAQR